MYRFFSGHMFLFLLDIYSWMAFLGHMLTHFSFGDVHFFPLLFLVKFCVSMSNGNLLSVTYVEYIFPSLFIGQTEGLYFYVVQSVSLSCLVSILDLMFKKLPSSFWNYKTIYLNVLMVFSCTSFLCLHLWCVWILFWCLEWERHPVYFFPWRTSQLGEI